MHVFLNSDQQKWVFFLLSAVKDSTANISEQMMSKN